MFLGGSIRAKSVLQKHISKFRANREGPQKPRDIKGFAKKGKAACKRIFTRRWKRNAQEGERDGETPAFGRDCIVFYTV